MRVSCVWGVCEVSLRCPWDACEMPSEVRLRECRYKRVSPKFGFLYFGFLENVS